MVSLLQTCHELVEKAACLTSEFTQNAIQKKLRSMSLPWKDFLPESLQSLFQHCIFQCCDAKIISKLILPGLLLFKWPPPDHVVKQVSTTSIPHSGNVQPGSYLTLTGGLLSKGLHEKTRPSADRNKVNESHLVKQSPQANLITQVTRSYLWIT